MAADVSPVQDSGATTPPADNSDALVHRSGFLDGLRQRAKTAGHTVANALHQTVEKAQQAAHSPGAQKAKEEAIAIGKDAAAPEINHVQHAIDAGKRGDIAGAVRNGAPVAAEALLGPHTLIKKAGEQVGKAALHQAEQHASDQGQNHSQSSTESHHLTFPDIFHRKNSNHDDSNTADTSKR